MTVWRFAFSTVTVPFLRPRANFSRTSKVDSSPSAAGSTRTRTAFTQRAEHGTNEALHQCSVQGQMWTLEGCLSGGWASAKRIQGPFPTATEGKEKECRKSGFYKGFSMFFI